MVKRLEDLAPQGLLERAREAASLVDRVSRVRVFCHYDPDGTTSASILTRALMRRGNGSTRRWPMRSTDRPRRA